MNKTIIFAKRNFKELYRDLLTLIFTILLPVFIYLMILFLARQIDIPNTAFEIENFTPSTIVFAFSFLSLFAAMLVSRDRSTAFLTRLLTSPLKASNFILGYALPVLLIALIQNIVIFILALFYGLNFSFNIFLAILATIPVSVIFAGIGLVLGSLFNEKQASGITSIIIQVVAFTSGMWFDVNMIGGAFKAVSNILPFAHSVDLLKSILSGNYIAAVIPLAVVTVYAAALTLLAIFCFKLKSKK